MKAFKAALGGHLQRGCGSHRVECPTTTGRGNLNAVPPAGLPVKDNLQGKKERLAFGEKVELLSLNAKGG